MTPLPYPEWSLTILETEPYWAIYKALYHGVTLHLHSVSGRSTFPFWGS